MTLIDLISSERPFVNSMVHTADFLIVVSAEGKILNNLDVCSIRINNFGLSEQLEEMNVLSVDKFNSNNEQKLRWLFAGNRIGVNLMMDNPDATFLVVTVDESPKCVVVIEKFFDNGQHTVLKRMLPVSKDSIDISFTNEKDCDVFRSVFDTMKEANFYLGSDMYKSLVEKRYKNRMAKKARSD